MGKADNGREDTRHREIIYIFSCPAVFKKYDVSEGGKRSKSKYTQQGRRNIFVGLPDDSIRWLFYVPDTKKIFVSIDAVFNKDVISSLSAPDLFFSGAIKIRDHVTVRVNDDAIIESTSGPSSKRELYQNEIFTSVKPCGVRC